MSRIPVTLVTGFLGSGKTTLIGQLLRQPGFEKTLVVINEFGEAGIDHDLIEASSDDTMLLANGCLCCTIRGNLVDTLLDLRKQVAEGRLRDFDRIVVETSGVADPAALLGFLLGEAEVMAGYDIEGVVTTVEAVNGAETLEGQPEAALQARVADRLLITKSDLVGDNAMADLQARLAAFNPGATIMTVVKGDVPPEAVIGLPRGEKHFCGPDCGHHDHDHAHHHHDHASRFRSVSLRPVRALTAAEVAPMLEAIRAHAGPDMLRLKGLLPLAKGGHLVVQATLATLHPPETRSAPLHGEGRLVIITDRAAPEALLAALAPFGLRA
ncbi:GTP-binding protein [Acetobacteraceae bacterium H6797]|nr:GTP-binding protein [Acetobacteraceae bacterium H6797]